jgi:hypothetical protein
VPLRPSSLTLNFRKTPREQRFQHFDRFVAQRNAMFSAYFHSVAGHGRCASREINLVPKSANYLSGSGRSQDCKFERVRCDALALSERGHECRYLSIGKSGMMLRFREPRASSGLL